MALLTDLDVINNACTQLGIAPLGNDGMDEDSDTGGSVAAAYEEVVDFNLGVYLFSFGQELRQLSLDDTAAPLTGYSYVFDVPAEAIGAPLYLTDDITSPTRRYGRYVLQGHPTKGGQIHAGASPLYAAIRFRPLPHRWSPAFKSSVITGLKAKLALSVREDKTLSQDLYAEAYGTPSQDFRGGQLGAAIRADSFSTPALNPNWNNNPLTRAWTGDDTGSEADA